MDIKRHTARPSASTTSGTNTCPATATVLELKSSGIITDTIAWSTGGCAEVEVTAGAFKKGVAVDCEFRGWSGGADADTTSKVSGSIYS